VRLLLTQLASKVLVRVMVSLNISSTFLSSQNIRFRYVDFANHRCFGGALDMLTELARREKEANIKPDPDIDIFMKVSYITPETVNFVIIWSTQLSHNFITPLQAMSTAGEKTNVMTDYILKV